MASLRSARHTVPVEGLAWAILPVRALSFAAFQGVIAAAFAVSGRAGPWTAAAAWWPYTAIATNLVCLALLGRLMRAEGGRYRDLVALVDRRTMGRDALTALGVLVVASAVVLFPSYGLGRVLFGDPNVPAGLFFRPLPAAAAWVALAAFPVTIALAELPTYLGYALPRLARSFGRTWPAAIVVALFLSAQHATLPLLFDARFVLWRLLMFLPLALVLSFAVGWRRRLLPYLMVAHGLLDLQAVWTVAQLSVG